MVTRKESACLRHTPRSSATPASSWPAGAPVPQHPEAGAEVPIPALPGDLTTDAELEERGGRNRGYRTPPARVVAEA